MRKTPELDLQEQVCGFLRVATIPPARFWFCPNGGNLSKVQRARFQKAGLTPGIADLHFIWLGTWESEPAPFYGTIELKAGRGKLSAEQEEFRNDMFSCGHEWAVCRALPEVIATLTAWGFPLRKTSL